MRSSGHTVLAAVHRWLIVGITGGLLVVGCGSLISAVARAQRIIEVTPLSPTGRLLTRRLGDWELSRPVTEWTPVAFERAQRQRALLIREYGLRDVAIGLYRRSDGASVRIELFRMINYVAAYGAYSLERSAPAERVPVGTEGTQEAGRLGFFKGEYYARLSVVEGDIDKPALLRLAQRLDARLGDRHSEIPVLVRQLPSADLVPGTERFIAGPRGLARFRPPGDQEDVFLLTSLGVEAALAQYQTGGTTSQLMIVEYHTPQLAAMGRRRVNKYFRSLPEDERAHRILKPEGNYLIEVTNVHDRKAMQQVVDQIKYAPVVQWLGKDPFRYLRQLRSIPQFSSVDWLLTTFGFIGLAVLVVFLGGVLLGTAAFLWRRRRFRYSASFTDAGGMLRLNLDHLVLPPEDRQVRRQLSGS